MQGMMKRTETFRIDRAASCHFCSRELIRDHSMGMARRTFGMSPTEPLPPVTR